MTFILAFILSLFPEVSNAPFAICADGQYAETAVERWEEAGLPVVERTCEGEPLRLIHGPWPAHWCADYENVRGCAVPEIRLAYCSTVAACQHELGHLLALSHPEIVEGNCAGRFGAYMTVMDNIPCPGQTTVWTSDVLSALLVRSIRLAEAAGP